jgi:hypothetical protein
MTSLAALLLATPVFGFVLEAPAVEPLLQVPALVSAAPQSIGPGLMAAVAPTGPRAYLLLDDEEGADGSSDGSELSDDSPQAEAEPKDGAAESEQDKYVREVKERNAIASIHRPFGIATWAAMTVTVVLGTIQYYNLYGFFAGKGSNPCVEGDAVFGQDQCTGFPWPHALAAGLTTALYATTFTLSLMMPDPDDFANAKGEYAERVRLHKLLRWVSFTGMLVQIGLGIVIANAFDRANDYDTLQALGTVHLAAGLVTYGALTWAGALMTF